MEKAIQQYLERHGFERFCPKAVLFDMDGVIYDSMPNHSTSWHDSMAAFGLDMPYEGAYEYEGMRGVETIKTLMEQIKADGLKICVVTGSAQHALLDKLLIDFDGLLREELIVTAFDVKHGKPNPEPYLIGMGKCGTEPYETIVVENAPLGVQAAAAARCFTIAVNTGPLPDERLAEKGADIIFPTMTALSDTWKTLHEEWL